MEHAISLFFRSIFVDNMVFAFFLGMFKVDGACFQLCHTPAYEGYHYECYKNKYWCYHFLNVVIFCCKSTIFF